MFKFNFGLDGSGDGSDKVAVQDEAMLWTDESVNGFECEEIKAGTNIKDQVDPLSVYKIQLVNDNELLYHTSDCVAQEVFEDGKTAESSNETDLLPGLYEGGAKVWECTTDLANYLILHEDMLESLSGKCVLDLGCGAGLLGILTLQYGASVYFQDYNKHVIEMSTIPNVYLNADDEESEEQLKRCKFHCGDWEKYRRQLSDSVKFDLILTSETIYNPENYRKLISLLSSLLKPNGKILLAAKTYYFGVGGGARDFEKQLEKESNLKSTVVWETNENVKREILLIEFK